MPRIVRFHKVGGPEVLQFDQIETPVPGNGEVVIRVKALGLNRAESMFRQGMYLVDPVLPSKIGYEAAGIVESVGPDVKGIAKGDIVSVTLVNDMGKYGVYGEIALVPAKRVVKHPTNLSFEEASAIWMQYLTAYGALVDIADVKKGDYVVITAASSSVGIAAIQLTLLLGGIPIATTRNSEKKKQLESVGAKYVIATDEENLSERLLQITQNKGARVVFDPIGGKIVNQLAAGMSTHGILIEYGALSSEPTPYPLLVALQKRLSMVGYVVLDLLNDPEKNDRAIKFINEALSSGKFKPVIGKTFKLDQIVEAHRYLESNKQFGKIVVTV